MGGLASICIAMHIPRLLAGDFNKTINLDERNHGGPKMSWRCTRFRHWIKNNGPIDLGYSGPKFTWSKIGILWSKPGLTGLYATWPGDWNSQKGMCVTCCKSNQIMSLSWSLWRDSHISSKHVSRFVSKLLGLTTANLTQCFKRPGSHTPILCPTSPTWRPSSHNGTRRSSVTYSNENGSCGPELKAFNAAWWMGTRHIF